MASRTEAAKNRARHGTTGRFVKQSGNGNSKRAPQYSTPVGISPSLARMLRPQAAFRWILPNRAAITPQYVEMVMRGALAGNHVQQWEMFDFMLDSWPELHACWNELRDGVTGKKVVIEPHHDEDMPPEPEAVERARLVSVALNGMTPNATRDENGLNGLIGDILDGWMRGITVQEVLWQQLEDDDLGTIMAPASTFWCHPVTYGFNADGQLGLRTIPGYDTSGRNVTGTGPTQNTPPISSYPLSYLSAQPQPATLEPFPPHKFLVGIHKSKPGTALGGPLLRCLTWWWVAAGYCEDWLLNLSQLYGIPFRYATYDPNAPDETISAITTMLQNMGSNGWAAFPTGTELEFKDGSAGRDNDKSPQATMLDRADRYARLLILGQTMTGNTLTGGKGGQAFGVVEKDVKQERIDAAGKYACEVINKQLIASILLLNYGDTQDAPRLRLLEENEGQFVDAQRDQILQKIGLQLGADFMRRKYGIPEPAEGEEVIEPPQPEPFGGGGFGGDNRDGQPQDLRESQPGMEQGDKAMQAGDYSGHPFRGNQYTGPGFKTGDVVKYAHPQNEEEGKLLFHVKESHHTAIPPRVHITPVHWIHGRIKPIEVVHPSELVHHKPAFPSITYSAEDERRKLQNLGIQTAMERISEIEDDALFAQALSDLAKGVTQDHAST